MTTTGSVYEQPGTGAGQSLVFDDETSSAGTKKNPFRIASETQSSIVLDMKWLQ